MYGRKVAGKNDDGTTKMGSWVQLLTFDVPLLRANSVTVTKARDVTESDENNPDATNIDLSGNVYYIPKDYVELGFEFETVSGLSWAYSMYSGLRQTQKRSLLTQSLLSREEAAGGLHSRLR